MCVFVLITQDCACPMQCYSLCVRVVGAVSEQLCTVCTVCTVVLLYCINGVSFEACGLQREGLNERQNSH